MEELNCIKCGACCYFPKSIGKNDKSGKIVVGEDGWCIHRTDKGCDIYDDKPEPCIVFDKDSPQCLDRRKRYKTI